MLAVTDQEIEFFKNDVEKFNDIEKQIKDLKEKIKPYQAKIKELTQKKKEKQEEVLNFMESNDLDVANVGDSSLELKNTSVTKSVSKADVYDRLYKYFSEDTDKTSGMDAEQKSKFLHNYIYIEGREKTQTKSLKSKD
tara:strand:+ start:1511 stop:1924 length:414 start_codon:yes stop_codon:yes gene_type:complete